jgi:hypothetical protein
MTMWGPGWTLGANTTPVVLVSSYSPAPGNIMPNAPDYYASLYASV